MAKYDPNWLTKAKHKASIESESRLSHVLNDVGSTGLCGRGFGAKGYPSITVIQFPSIDSLPTCRVCREKFLSSIGVEFDETGYPKK